MSGSRQTPPAFALAKSISTEALVHTAILIFILLPLFLIIFPALVILIATTMLSHAVPESALAQGIAAAPGLSFVVAAAVATAIGALAVAAGLHDWAPPQTLKELSWPLSRASAFYAHRRGETVGRRGGGPALRGDLHNVFPHAR